MRKLTIIHNHGRVVIEDVVVEKYVWDGIECMRVRGRIVDGGYTNRFLHASVTEKYVAGTEIEWDLYGRRPWESGDDEWVVSCTYL